MISGISGSSSLNQSYMTQMRQQMFSKIDTDGDGKHSKEEISAMIANGPQGGPSVDEIFSRADTDGDGSISQIEFEADSTPDRQIQGSGFGGMGSVTSADFLQQMFNKIDTNGDGALGTDEISQMVANGPQGGPSVADIFSESDTDGDGTISQAEFEAVQASKQQEQESMAGMEAATSSDFQQQMFSKIDTDGDGALSMDEISSMVANGPQGGPSADEIFDTADTNKDGYVSQAEFEAAQPDKGAQDSNSAQSSSNAQDTLFTKLLEDLKNEATSTSSTSGNAAHLLSAAIQSYMQSSTDNYSQSNMNSLLGSSLYV
jgi:Ca2+-binding EF-hand superfamily protein